MPGHNESVFYGRHCPDGADGIAADRRLIRQDEAGITPCQQVVEMAHFGACGFRVFREMFEHLPGHQHRQARTDRGSNRWTQAAISTVPSWDARSPRQIQRESRPAPSREIASVASRRSTFPAIRPPGARRRTHPASLPSWTNETAKRTCVSRAPRATNLRVEGERSSMRTGCSATLIPLRGRSQPPDTTTARIFSESARDHLEADTIIVHSQCLSGPNLPVNFGMLQRDGAMLARMQGQEQLLPRYCEARLEAARRIFGRLQVQVNRQ